MGWWLPVPRAAALRSGPRGGVLRPGAAHRRAGRPARRDRDRHGDRWVGRRQNLAAGGRPGARAGPRRTGARVAGLARSQPHRDRAAAHRPGRRTGRAGQPGSGRHQAAAGRSAGPGAPADPRAHQERRRLVLIVDQFERVFAADGAQERAERAAFVDALSAAAARPAGPRDEPPARVVIAVRGDYWDRCATLPQLVEAMERDQLVVGPMPDAGLRRAITGPAGASGLRVENALIEAMVADTSAVGASLPMLSQALTLTWENREDGRLTRAGYDRAGRVAGAIGTGAEAVYARLTEDQQAIARDVLRQMAAVDRDGRLVRRPVPNAGDDRRADAEQGALAQGGRGGQ